MLILALIPFACFLLGILSTRFLGDGFRSFICILLATTIIYIGFNPELLGWLRSTALTPYLLLDALLWNVFPYFIFCLFPAFVGHLFGLSWLKWQLKSQSKK
jgi:hypothetical protein